MKWEVVIGVAVVAIVSFTACSTGMANRTRHCSWPRVKGVAASETGRCAKQPEVIYDDLGWLVGRWRCISNCVQGIQDSALKDAGLRPLELSLARVRELNVYYPFDDAWSVTLELKRIPERHIVAELVEQDGTLSPLHGYQPVTIGIDTIAFGYFSPFGVRLQYQYLVDEENNRDLLLLWSKSDRLGYSVSLVFEKTSDWPEQKSLSRIVPQEWLREELKFSKRKYETIKRELLSGRATMAGTRSCTRDVK